MDPLFARYPFLESAREAVDRESPSIDDLVAGDRSAALDRAIDRIEAALSGDTVGDIHRDVEVEVLSYPLARILTSLLDDTRVTERYVRAEANTAVGRFRTDFRHDGSDAAIDRDRVLEEFDLAVVESDGHQLVDVVQYLELATDLEGAEWHLVNRPLAGGAIPVSHDELFSLLEAAVRRRVDDGLPLDVPEPIEEALAGAVSRLEQGLGRSPLPTTFEAVDPARFPPCMQALVRRVGAGDRLPPRARFALAAFLTSIGADPGDFEEIIDAPVPDELHAMATVVAGDEGPTQFPPGSCETLVVYDVCTDPDELCERIDNPLEYYERRLAGVEP